MADYDYYYDSSDDYKNLEQTTTFEEDNSSSFKTFHYISISLLSLSFLLFLYISINLFELCFYWSTLGLIFIIFIILYSFTECFIDKKNTSKSIKIYFCQLNVYIILQI